MFLPFYIEKEELIDLDAQECPSLSISRRELQRHNFALWFTLCMPLFPMTYMMAYRRAISGTITVLMFQFLSMATKGIYAAVLLDTHKDALIFAELALDEERRANESRREFLKYLFHEVRTPLNSLPTEGERSAD
jgi:signal transduction histidine kinase